VRGKANGSLVAPLTGRRWSPAAIAGRVRQATAAQRARGLQPGNRVFVHFGNCNEFFVELLAAWRAGACVVPLDPGFAPSEIEALASWAKPRLSLWNGPPDPDVFVVLERLGVENVDVASRELGVHQAAQDDSRWAARLDDDALILFTSGTTGQPKGVAHTHRSLLARWSSLHDRLDLESFARTLCLLPTHFGHGLICNSLFPWLSGCELHLLPPFRPQIHADLGSVIDEHEISFMSSVPTVWRLVERIAARPRTQSLARVFIGSAPLSQTLWETVREWSGTQSVCNAYGITETASWLAGTSMPHFTPEDGLVGEPWGGTLRVVQEGDPGDPTDPGAVCGPEEEGRVWVRTPALMRGYLDRDDLTDAVVVNGWFLTGDLGAVDSRGWLYLRGRERDEINKGGMKVHPSDIDAVIERFPAATDVCTFGFAEPFLGEDVGVAVVLSNGDDATIVALHDWATAHLARHQVPQRWYFLREIPRSSRGKVNREAVANRCSAETPANIGEIRNRASNVGLF
jgi:acyl-CoA synthetase (AMP-forming)/AMP-acid ligase II